MSDPRITKLLDRAAAIATKYGHEALAADWAASRERFARTAVVRRRLVSWVAAPLATMPALSRRPRRVRVVRCAVVWAAPSQRRMQGHLHGCLASRGTMRATPDELPMRPSGRTRGSLSAALLAGAPSRTGRPTPEEHAAGVRRPASGVTMGAGSRRARDGPARTG